ncbi:MAG TPA: folate-binding protein [Candidatus Angelobacter sp.]
MPSTTLNQRTASYNGAESVAAFADPLSELRALTSGCGVFELAWRGKITVSGKDRVRWLNSMVTNTIKDLPQNRGNYSLLLNPQGRILGDMYIYNLGEYFLLDTDRPQLEAIRNTLKRFIIMDKVELADSNLSAIGICGPKSEEVMAAAGIDAKGMQPLEVREQAGITIVRGPEQRPFWYELPGDRSQVTGYREKLIRAGAQPVGTEALESWRIIHGIPNYGQDIRERDLPQETEQAQALNFTKGCYIGQEIVERIRSRGQVHRKFTGFEFEGGLPQPGKFEENGRLLAEITSVAEVGGRKIGLGYVRRETGSAGAKLNLGGTTATVVAIPFQKENL